MARTFFGLLGMLILVNPTQDPGQMSFAHLDVLALIFATISWAVGSVIGKKIPLPTSPFVTIGIEMLAGGVLMSIAGLLHGELPAMQVAHISSQSLFAVAYLILFGSLIGFSAYVWLLEHVEASKVATYAYVNPVIALLLGWLMGGEPMNIQVLASAGVILAGVVLVLKQRS